MLRPFLTVHPQTFKMCLLSCSCVPQRLDVVNFMQMLYHSRSLFYDSLCGWLTVTGTERWSFREKSCSLAQSELQLIVAHQSLEVHPSRWKLLWGGAPWHSALLHCGSSKPFQVTADFPGISYALRPHKRHQLLLCKEVNQVQSWFLQPTFG